MFTALPVGRTHLIGPVLPFRVASGQGTDVYRHFFGCCLTRTVLLQWRCLFYRQLANLSSKTVIKEKKLDEDFITALLFQSTDSLCSGVSRNFVRERGGFNKFN